MPVVAVALVIVGLTLFFVLYKRQNKIFRVGSSRSATNSPWNSQTSGLMRGRSVDLTRPLFSPQSKARKVQIIGKALLSTSAVQLDGLEPK